MVALMSPEENSYSLLLWPKMMTATSTEHRTESSWAFLKRPPLRLRNVLRVGQRQSRWRLWRARRGGLHGAVAVILDGLDLDLAAAHGGGWRGSEGRAHRRVRVRVWGQGQSATGRGRVEIATGKQSRAGQDRTTGRLRRSAAGGQGRRTEATGSARLRVYVCVCDGKTNGAEQARRAGEALERDVQRRQSTMGTGAAGAELKIGWLPTARRLLRRLECGLGHICAHGHPRSLAVRADEQAYETAKVPLLGYFGAFPQPAVSARPCR